MVPAIAPILLCRKGDSMKHINTKEMANGKRRVTLELAPNEAVNVIEVDRFYSLGGQMEDVVPARVIGDARKVNWCHLEQKWIPV